jgi:hypothetical protein
MKFKRGLGIFLFLIGVFILISSQSGMTGNIVSDRVSAISSILGLVFIIGGILLFVGLNEYRQENKNLVDLVKEDKYFGEPGYRRKKMINQIPSNREAKEACKWNYKQEYRRKPTEIELREYMRHLHENKEIPYIVMGWKKRKK